MLGWWDGSTKHDFNTVRRLLPLLISTVSVFKPWSQCFPNLEQVLTLTLTRIFPQTKPSCSLPKPTDQKKHLFVFETKKIDISPEEWILHDLHLCVHWGNKDLMENSKDVHFECEVLLEGFQQKPFTKTVNVLCLIPSFIFISVDE